MWLYVPSTPSAFAPEAVASTSESSWQCQALARSCSWRGKPSPARTWSQRCNKVSWLKLLCGAMSPPSTADHGAASWMASLAEYHASRILSPADDSAPTTSATCGPTPAASSSSPALGSCSSRTSAASSRQAARSGFSETYPDLVLRVRSDCLRRQKSARATGGSDCSGSQWPTATASKGGDNTNSAAVVDRGQGNNLVGIAVKFAEQWPTPTSRDHRSLEASEATHDRNARPLSEFVGMWSTPRASDGEKGGPNQSYTTIMLPPLPAQATSFRPAPPTSTDGETSSPERRSLNPLFVEWLMGWPPGWTSFACSATALSHWKQRMRSALWQLGLPPEDQPAQMSLFE